MVRRFLSFALLAFVVCPAVAAPIIRNPKPLNVSGSPYRVLSANFAGDSAEDLLLVESGKSLQVLVSVANGPFAAPVVTPLPDGDHTGVAVGDVNGDGKRDVVLTEESHGFFVYLGNGDGSFQAGATGAVTGLANDVVLADFTGDQILDMAIATEPASNEGAIEVHAGNGSGGFGAAIATTVEDPGELLVIDANRDGKSDLVLSTWISTYVLLGDGAGHFTSSQAIPEAGGLADGDYNGDGKPDFAIAAGGTHDWYVTVYLGHGDGTFISLASDPAPYSSSAVDGVDVDHDGNLDLVLASWLGDVAVLRGIGNGTFAPPQFWLAHPGAYDFAAGDFDRNGSVDLVLAGGVPSAVFIAGTVDGSFDVHRAYMPWQKVPVLWPGSDPVNTIAADMNGDGKPDVVTRVTDQWSNREIYIGVMLNDGSGNLGAATLTDLHEIEWSGPEFAVGDMNGDGKNDVVVISNYAYEPSGRTYLSNGDGTFQPPVPFALSAAGDPVLSDLTGDGVPDLVMGFYDTSMILRGASNGTFASPVTLTFPASGIGDLNGDGHPDLVGKRSGDIVIGIGDGNLNFARTYISTGDEGSWGGLGDFNGDNHLDMLTLTYNGTGVRFGHGDGTFGDPVRFVISPDLAHSTPVRVIDFDADGKLDMIFGSTIFFGHGDGTFHSSAAARSRATTCDVADFDGNGSLDLVLTNREGGTLSIVRTRIGPDPTTATTVTLESDVAAPTYAQPVNYTATVNGGTHTDGSVLFSKDGVPYALSVLTRLPAAQSANLPVGTHQITAAYSGDDYHLPSSNMLEQNIARAQTSLNLGFAPAWTCRAEIPAPFYFSFPSAAGLPGPSGLLDVREGAAVIPVRRDAFGNFYLQGLGVGTHTLAAQYPGDTNYEPSNVVTYDQSILQSIFTGISAGSAVFANASGNFASLLGSGPAGTTWTWTITNGTIDSGQGTRNIRYTAGASGEVTLSVRGSLSGSNCDSTASRTVPIINRAAGASMFFLVNSCRAVDTRSGSAIASGETRDIAIGGLCGVPADAKSAVVNVTAVAPAAAGWLSLFPSDAAWPGTSTMNYRSGRTRANGAIVPLSAIGHMNVKNSGTPLHVIIDVLGYFQ